MFSIIRGNGERKKNGRQRGRPKRTGLPSGNPTQHGSLWKERGTICGAMHTAVMDQLQEKNLKDHEGPSLFKLNCRAGEGFGTMIGKNFYTI